MSFSLCLTVWCLSSSAFAEDVALPPGADAAAAQVADSPRHGEWVDVELPDSDHAIKTWVVYPERADNAPVVIVIHEIFGMSDWIRGVADQLAAEGFIAVAPDLLSGMGPDGGGTESLGREVRSVIRQLSPDDRTQRLNAIREYALALPSANGKLGCVGFCWGGSTSFIYATSQPELDAAVVYYGSAPDDADVFANVGCPVLGLYGEDDNRINSTIPATQNAMDTYGKAYTTHIYDGAGHGFLRQQDGRDGANLEATKQAWPETLAFFREHLEAGE